MWKEKETYKARKKLKKKKKTKNKEKSLCITKEERTGKTEADTKVYDLNLKTMQALDRKADVNTTFEDTWAFVENETAEGDLLLAVKRTRQWTSLRRLSNARPAFRMN